MNKGLTLNILSDPALLQEIRLKTEAVAAAAGFDDASVGEIGLVVNEALANVIRHAYGNDHTRPIEYAVRAEQGGLTVEIRDWGNGVDPSLLPVSPKDPLVPGGLGLICLRRMMDRVAFERQNPGMLLKMHRMLSHRPMGGGS